jgi:hypothetical protein
MTTSLGVRTRRGPRIFVAVLLVLALGGLFGALAGQLRGAIDGDARFVAAERQGVAYLRPLTRLVAGLANAQSAAVRGQPIDPVEVDAAAAAVSDLDKRTGAELRTQQRWADLRTEVEKVLSERPTGRAAMARFSDVVGLATELARTVGDTSNLILDPELDSFYLMDTALLQMPTILTAPGRSADHTYLASAKDADHPDLIDAAVARQQVATATEAIGTGLRKAIDATTGGTLGPGLTEQLDAFRSAVDRAASPAALRQVAGPADAGALFAAAQQVRETALPLATAVLTELDNLLAAREGALRIQRTIALATTAAGVILGVILLWWSVPARGRGQGAETAADYRGEGGHPLDVASVSVQLPELDARDLLAFEELVHVGRGVRARPKDEADDAQ